MSGLQQLKADEEEHPRIEDVQDVIGEMVAAIIPVRQGIPEVREKASQGKNDNYGKDRPDA